MNRRKLRPALLALIVVCADGLFFGHSPGLSIALFLVSLDAGVVLANPVRANRREMMTAAGLLGAALLLVVENAGPLSCLLSVLAAANFALVSGTKIAGTLAGRVAASFRLLVAEPFRLCGVLILSLERKLHGDAMRSLGGALVIWTVPTTLGGIFLLLFLAANPVLAGWFAGIRVDKAFAAIDGWRVSFWLVIAAITGPFLFPCEPRTGPAKLATTPQDVAKLPDWVRGDAAILRSLAVFNLLFAVQTVMDIRYLWRGAALPQGMTFADYAHRGAYPLVVTALLAGGFVFAAMKPGSTGETSPVIRTLLFAWTAQNVLLMVSSMLRLKLYVELYSLTYWRIAAFIWMFLVATGLVLVVARIAFHRSNAWLATMNLSALGLTLYLCGFVNFPSVVAMYNVTHSREMSGSGPPLDIGYLARLGPQAIPAIDLYAAHRRLDMPLQLEQCREKLAALHLDSMKDWRTWSFRGWRLQRYLEGNR